MIIIDLRSPQTKLQTLELEQSKGARFAPQASAGAFPRATNRRDAFGTLALGISNPYYSYVTTGCTHPARPVRSYWCTGTFAGLVYRCCSAWQKEH